MTRRKLALTAVGTLAAILLLALVAALFVLQSGWFQEKVRQTIVAAVEDATGGHAEIGSFQFDWSNLRADVRQFVLHGNEPAGKPPLLRASSLSIGLKILSVLRRQVNVRYLSVQDPQIHLIIDADGHTNIPEPKIKRREERTALDTLINLAIGQFDIRNGIFEIEARTRIPFNARGRNLGAKFVYNFIARRYQGDLSIEPLEVQWNGRTEAPLAVQTSVALEKDRITIANARLASGDSRLDFSGTIEDLVAPRISVQYEVRATALDINRLFHVPDLEGGTVQLAGNAQWSQASQYVVNGNLRIAGGAFQQPRWRIRNAHADASLRVDSAGVRLGGLRFAGEGVNDGGRIPLEGRATELTLRGNDLDARGLALTALGGSFTGDARLRAWNRFEARGELHNLEARRAVAIYSRTPLPWNSLVSGSVEIQGSTRQRDLRVSANLAVAPAPQSPPVHGQLAILYDQGTGLLELGRSTLTLPASRVDLAGAIGRQLRVHLETRNVDDFLPVLGDSAASVPVKLQNGSAVFDGTVTGRLERPQIAGHLALTRFSYAGRAFDTLQADVNASSDTVRVQNGTLARGDGRAQFQGSVGLQDWKAAEASALSGSGSLRNAAVSDLLALLNQKNVAVTGTLNASGQVSGTIANPQATADLEVVKGTLRDEPFDRFTAHLTHSNGSLQLSQGQLTAGTRRVQLAATFDHPVNRFDTGRLRFQIQSNALPLAQIQTLAKPRPGLQGTVQFSASGGMDLSAASNSGATIRLTELQADITARGLQLTGQPLGDAHLTATSQGSLLRAHLDSSFANSGIRGDGEWRMEGDYPGNATVSFTKIDLVELREWIAPSPTRAPPPFKGFAEGEFHITGPALKPELLKADLRIPNLEIRPASGVGSIVLKNSGPIVASAANSVITIEHADLTGRSTEVKVAGKVSPFQRNALDLRLNGHLDLALLQTFNADLNASGMLVMDATVRGPLATPQVNGRLDLNDGTMTYGMLPNGISDATGVILFTGDRATIQNLEATTGGGRIQLSGFAGYNEDGTIFGLHAIAKQVRVRYPEGVSTVADATLDFSGSTDRSTLSGNITIRRAGVNLESDLGAMLAKSAEPVRTPAGRGGFLAGINYDVQIETAPDIEFESSLTQDLQADAMLRLRGTTTNPALLGRISITQGQINFFGTKYTINQGSISFFNPVRVEPVMNIDLETRARGIDITLTVSGPLNKLTVTPRSDPPLQFNEIISLLTTGEAPISDVTRLGQQATLQQPAQQSAATALLGQVIANPVSGRLQRFFGISKLRINPTLDPALANGVQYNPQARLTLEQQVTPNITFTYITNMTNANPQIVSVEWSVSKQWSVVAQREENGLLGLDFYLKKRFK